MSSSLEVCLAEISIAWPHCLAEISSAWPHFSYRTSVNRDYDMVTFFNSFIFYHISRVEKIALKLLSASPVSSINVH